MDKKILIIIPIALVLIVLGFIFFQKIRPHEIKNDYFTIEPAPWIEDTPFDDTPNNIEINVRKATRSESQFDLDKQEYYHNGLKTIFSSGIYKGFPFGVAHKAGNDTVISIGPEMDPNDGIIEGFILGKYEDEDFVFYVFLDEDWKKQIEYTNIVYANDLSIPSIQKFEFTDSVKGVYVNKVEGNFDWFLSSPRQGGVYVGELDLDTLKLEDVSQTNLTFIYVR